jgi:Putative prokaryotic signal transducing protein
MNQWTKVFATKSLAEASIVQGMLSENQIPVQQLNKQDSSYPVFGEIDIFVPFHLKDTAIQLIQQTFSQ